MFNFEQNNSAESFSPEYVSMSREEVNSLRPGEEIMVDAADDESGDPQYAEYAKAVFVGLENERVVVRVNGNEMRLSRSAVVKEREAQAA